jgi:hypothetical protein
VLNPFICPIHGDLSRADVVVLVQACRGKTVVEFGIGGSTIILSQVAEKVVSYETKQVWIDRFKDEFDKLDNVQFRILEENIDAEITDIEDCDVLFVDGWSLLRWPFLKAYWSHVKECAILHDARSPYAPNVVSKMITEYTPSQPGEAFPRNEYTACLKQIDWLPLESNMIVLHKRDVSLHHEDWKRTEEGNNRHGYGE